jgi:hypothetical protein
VYISVHGVRMVQVKTNRGDGELISTKVALATCGDHSGRLGSGLGGNNSYHQNMGHCGVGHRHLGCSGIF